MHPPQTEAETKTQRRIADAEGRSGLAWPRSTVNVNIPEIPEKGET
jgi:hypothetical protein